MPALLAQITGNNIITTFAGANWSFPNGVAAGNDIVGSNGIRVFSGDGGPMRSASMNLPTDAVMDSAGNLYISTGNNSRIRRVTPNGIISTYAGTGINGFSGDDGPATEARLNGDEARLALDAAETCISAKGAIIGSGKSHRPESSRPLRARAWPGRATVRRRRPSSSRREESPSTTPAICMSVRARIRKISSGVVTTIAGTGVFDSTGDGGPALSATFRFPQGLVFDRAGNLYIAEYGSSKFRVISPAGIITTAAGNGRFRNSPDGTAARNAYLFVPTGISFDPAGNLLIPDLFASRLRRIRPDGTIQVIAGIG